MNDAIRPDGHDTPSDDDRRLAALLASVQAEANPAVWARVRTRLAAAPARTPLDGFLDWLTRPAALAAATASLVVALGAGWTLLDELAAPVAVPGEEVATVDAATLMESLLEAEVDADATGAGEPVDDGTAPGDSGGRS